MVPVSEPLLSKLYVQSMMEHGHLACEMESSNKCLSFADSMLAYMDNCSGHGSGSTSTGKCTCNSGWYGADCSTKVTDLSETTAVDENISGARWTYYSVPATEAFSLTVAADTGIELYIRQGLSEIPDYYTFDSVLKNQTGIQLTQALMDFSEGAIISVHCTGKENEETNFSIRYNATSSLLDGMFISVAQLAASATPANPQFEYPDGDDINAKYYDDNMLTNMQFMVLGAVLGVVATLIYWQITKLCQSCMSPVESADQDQENQAAAIMEDPNKFLFIHSAKIFKEDGQRKDQDKGNDNDGSCA